VKDILIEKAKDFGASLAGITPLGPVIDSPSTKVHNPLRLDERSGSVLVLALEHPVDNPQLDHWGGSRGTEGNRILHEVIVKTVGWLRENHGIRARHLPYQVRSGGVYKKDAAVLSGLGVIGRNNLLITPELGPRIRFSAMLVEIESEPPPALDFDPCSGCPAPCLSVCPQNAFEGGSFSRPACMLQMDADEAAAGVQSAALVAYCRECELACPVGGDEVQS
jgi:epoxyqueuosine reductase